MKKSMRPVASSLNGIKGEFLTISKKRGYKDPLEAHTGNGKDG